MYDDQSDDTLDPAALRARLGPYGVWLGRTLVRESAAAARPAVAEMERLGFGAVWFGGDTPGGGEAISRAAVLLASTQRITVATGIASIWTREAPVATNAANTLADAWPDRFLLGLGVSHAPIVEARGHTYARPYTAMREYLDTMDEAAGYAAPRPAAVPRVLAALGPRMLELARDRTQGAHPYFSTPAHTEKARGILGPEPLLAPEHAVVVETDPERARAVARDYTRVYLSLPNYTNNLRALGWGEDDISGADGGSDALVDALVAWGDPDTVAARLRAHHDAGADHVAIQPLGATLADQVTQLRALVPALPG